MKKPRSNVNLQGLEKKGSRGMKEVVKAVLSRLSRGLRRLAQMLDALLEEEGRLKLDVDGEPVIPPEAPIVFGKGRVDFLSINIATFRENARIDVLTDEISPESYRYLLQFAAYYSPSGVVDLNMGGLKNILYQAVPVMDLEKAQRELTDLETGWRLEDNGRLLIPPKKSTLKLAQVREILRASSYETQAEPAQPILSA